LNRFQFIEIGNWIDKVDQRIIASRPAPPRSGSDLHIPRGCSGIQKTGPALFDRQGLVRSAASCQKSLLSFAVAVSASAYRHDMEISRNVRDAGQHGEKQQSHAG